MDGVCKCRTLKKRSEKRLKPNYKCLIQIYWRGKHYEYRRDDQGYVFTYDKAKDKLAEISTAIKKGTFNPIDFSNAKLNERRFDTKIQTWLEQKEKECAEGGISPSSLSNIRGYINNYYLPFFADWDVREIRFEQLEAFKDALPSTLKKKTKSNIVVSLHSFFTWLFKKGIRDIPPFPVVEGEEDARERVALDYADQVSYLQKIPSEHRDVLEFGMETGIRPGELVVLKGKDIDLRHGQALIGRTVSAYTHVLERTKGKTRRYIPLSDRALEIVKPHLTGKHPEQWLFINSDTRRRYSVKTPNAVWKRYTGLDTTYYEASRHSFCTQIVDDGADSLQAKQLMRHTDVRTTQNYYHGNTTKLRELVNRRGRVVSLKNRSEIEASPEEVKSNKIE